MHLDNKMLHSQDLCDCDSGIFSIPTLTSSLAHYNVVLDTVPPANGKQPCKRLSLVTLQWLHLKPGGTTAAAAHTHFFLSQISVQQSHWQQLGAYTSQVFDDVLIRRLHSSSFSSAAAETASGNKS